MHIFNIEMVIAKEFVSIDGCRGC